MFIGATHINQINEADLFLGTKDNSGNGNPFRVLDQQGATFKSLLISPLWFRRHTRDRCSLASTISF